MSLRFSLTCSSQDTDLRPTTFQGTKTVCQESVNDLLTVDLQLGLLVLTV